MSGNEGHLSVARCATLGAPLTTSGTFWRRRRPVALGPRQQETRIQPRGGGDTGVRMSRVNQNDPPRKSGKENPPTKAGKAPRPHTQIRKRPNRTFSPEKSSTRLKALKTRAGEKYIFVIRFVFRAPLGGFSLRNTDSPGRISRMPLKGFRLGRFAPPSPSFLRYVRKSGGPPLPYIPFFSLSYRFKTRPLLLRFPARRRGNK